MRSALILCACLVALQGSPADSSECYADYKAKQDSPLRLHYGVAQIPGTCTVGNATTELNTRLVQNGWTLLTVISVFGPARFSTVIIRVSTKAPCSPRI